MFGHAVSLALGFEAREALLSLMAQGLVVNDSLSPLRALLMQAPRARQKLLSQAGRWSCAAPLPEATLENRLEGVLSREGILCRETAGLARISWPEALDQLRIWEFTGRVRRGYFVKGLSGAQFVRETELSAVVSALAAPARDLYVLPAQDPAQAWGRILPHEEQRRFMCAEGVCVVLRAGQVALVSERQGEVLRWWGEPNDALQAFAQAFAAGRIYPGKPKLQTKEYPANGEAALSAAGFQAEMKSFVLWRTRL
jgi:ATP-dependent Lhr-like helicase